jgi:ribosomal protein S18 acetylase RimI-like enzyme
MRDEAPQVRIRRAGADDAAVLSELAARLFRQTYEGDVPAADLDAFLAASFSPDSQRNELDDPTTRTLLVELGHQAIGYAQVRRRSLPVETSDADAEVELARLYIDRPWHGRGVAAAVLAEAGRLALELGSGSVWLGVWERNGRAVAFYERRGFRPVGVQEFRLGSERHRDRVMVADIASLVDAPDER